MVRLIDADDIVLDYSGLANIPPLDFRGIAEYFAKQIDAMPTIKQEPERKNGKWIHYYDIEEGRALRCSECKMVFWVGDGREGNFCPNCGAKMDERKE